MSFCDFKGIWKVIEDEMGGEIEGHWVAIGGTPGAVKVICLHDPFSHAYPGFTYQEDPEQLTGPGDFPSKIERITSNVIKYTRPLTPGSWTADDNLG